MLSFLKKTIKVGICTAGLVGVSALAAFALVGKDRTSAVVHEIHGKVLESIDRSIDDPTALRAQLHEMEKEYPERIAQLRGDLAELQHEIRILEREQAISERVVELADGDLSRLETQLAAQVRGDAGVELIAVRAVKLDDHVYSMERAQVRLNQIRSTRIAYANRAADSKHDLVYLKKQEGRLHALLGKLEGERSEFQIQTPIVFTQRLKTQAKIPNGGTVVLAGLGSSETDRVTLVFVTARVFELEETAEPKDG